MERTIILWGTGERARQFLERGYFKACRIYGFVDTYSKNESFLGYRVYAPEDLKEILKEADALVIANQYFGEILEACIEMGLEWEKIVLTDHVREPICYKRFLKLAEFSQELFLSLQDRVMRLVKVNESDQKDADRLIGNDAYGAPVYMEDYFRFRTFEFAAREIKKQRTEGAIAELGVFRGTFSSLMNATFPDKKLYLFDTFEGFGQEEAEQEIRMGRCSENFVSAHKATSVARMLSNLPHPENCVVCKGFFPETVTQEASQEKYAFVSLDVDFEESTYQGLKFFYPRLSEGGMLFLHDYNTFYLDGVKLAVDRFEKESGVTLKKMPLADRAGTLVILK